MNAADANARPPVRRRWPRRLAIALAVLVALGVAFRLALNPFVTRHTRQVLATLKGYRGDFSAVSISLLKLSYSIDDLKLVQVPTPPGGSSERPFFYARRIAIGLNWRDLIHRRELVAAIDLDGPKLNFIAGPSKSESQGVQDPHLGDKLKRLAPLDIARIEVRDAEVAFTDDTAANSPALWLHALDGTLENVATRVGLSHGEPTTLAVSGTLQRTGQLSVFLTADPLSKALAFAGRAQVVGLALTDVGNFLVQKAELAPKKGTIDLFAELDAHDGRIAGGIKPVLKGVEVKPAKGGLGPALKAWIAGAGLKIFSDRVPGRDAASAVVPIEGTIGGPKAQLWPTIWSVLRNAFVVGIRSGFTELPPGSVAQKQQVLPQARSGQKGAHR